MLTAPCSQLGTVVHGAGLFVVNHDTKTTRTTAADVCHLSDPRSSATTYSSTSWLSPGEKSCHPAALAPPQTTLCKGHSSLGPRAAQTKAFPREGRARRLDLPLNWVTRVPVAYSRLRLPTRHRYRKSARGLPEPASPAPPGPSR